jgi:hypothetical protein
MRWEWNARYSGVTAAGAHRGSLYLIAACLTQRMSQASLKKLRQTETGQQIPDLFEASERS